MCRSPFTRHPAIQPSVSWTTFNPFSPRPVATMVPATPNRVAGMALSCQSLAMTRLPITARLFTKERSAHFPPQPERSLLLLKPTQEILHEGGKVLEPGSPFHQQIIDWMNQGMRYQNEQDPLLTHFPSPRGRQALQRAPRFTPWCKPITMMVPSGMFLTWRNGKVPTRTF